MIKSREWTIGVYVEVDDPRCAGNKTLTVSGPMVECKTTVIEKAPVDKLLDEVEEFMNNCIGWNLSRVEVARHEILKSIKEFRSNE